MDIQKIISDIVSKITGNNDLIKQFNLDPAAMIKKLTGFDVNADQLKQIVEGVTKALGSGALSEKKGLLAKIMAFFKK